MANEQINIHDNMISRLKAVQVVYSQKINQRPVQWVINDLHHTINNDEETQIIGGNNEFLEKLCQYHSNMHDHIQKICIKLYEQENRKIQNADLLIIAILECAIAEALSGLMKKPAITISAWLNIVQDFYPENPPISLINALLDKLFKQMEE